MDELIIVKDGIGGQQREPLEELFNNEEQGLSALLIYFTIEFLDELFPPPSLAFERYLHPPL
jgi:hypothetical protein